MKAKDYLYHLLNLEKKIGKYLDKREEILTKANTAYEMNPTGVIQKTGTTSDKTGDIILMLEEHDEKTFDNLNELTTLKFEASDLIDKLDDRNHRVVLRYRYLVCMEFEAIAEHMEYGYRYIYDLHRNALKEFQKVLDGEEVKLYG